MSSIINKFIDKVRLRRSEDQTVTNRYDWDGYRRVVEYFKPTSIPHKIYLNQIWGEWKPFMNFLIPERSPKRILEIGTGRGGSTYFLTKVGGENSLVVTVDTEPIAKQFVDLYRRCPNQKIHSLIGASDDPATLKKVERIFGKEPLDLLYIDGDHSYDGVKKDFELYKEFCGEKTIICFHDIVPDHGVSKGIQGEAYSGEVYKFWSELKKEHQHAEFVEAADQDGFGIGVLLPGLNLG